MSNSIVKNGLTLASIAAICTGLVATTYYLTQDRIAANEQAWLERSLAPALEGLEYEGSISQSKIILEAPHDLPGRDDAVIYRVYADDKPLAALFAVTAPDGYSGPIRILLGVDLNGVVTGLRILEHRETPGLGDKIESSRSDWVYQFSGHALGDPPVTGWFLRADGGQFDQLTGATVTPRAVLRAVRETLLYFEKNRDTLFAQAEHTEDSD
ncbi:MAG: electron transport complex subunit RsxG [Woeseiaceae bacterium]|nr:electron transport complex subunit RsxG [Woeseiaceae bacterium]